MKSHITISKPTRHPLPKKPRPQLTPRIPARRRTQPQRNRAATLNSLHNPRIHITHPRTRCTDILLLEELDNAFNGMELIAGFELDERIHFHPLHEGEARAHGHGLDFSVGAVEVGPAGGDGGAGGLDGDEWGGGCIACLESGNCADGDEGAH